MFKGINTYIFDEDQKLEAIETIVLGKTQSEIVPFCLLNSLSGQAKVILTLKAHLCGKEAWSIFFSIYCTHYTSSEH